MRNDRANYAYYLRNGNCPRCYGMRKVEPGKKMCAVCAAEAREASRKRREKWKAEGRCHSCGRELTDDGFVTCELCRNVRGVRRSNYMKQKRLAWKAEGKCQECGKRWAEAGKTMCKPCLKALNDRLRRNDPDNAKKYAWRQARIDKGLCIDCGRKAEPGKQRCERCRRMRKESEEKYRLKKKLAKQGNRDTERPENSTVCCFQRSGAGRP